VEAVHARISRFHEEAAALLLNYLETLQLELRAIQTVMNFFLLLTKYFPLKLCRFLYEFINFMQMLSNNGVNLFFLVPTKA
jgi:hypothetical protein